MTFFPSVFSVVTGMLDEVTPLPLLIYFLETCRKNQAKLYSPVYMHTHTHTHTHIHTCTHSLGPVKKCGLLKILHEKYRAATGIAKQRVIQEVQEFRLSLSEAAEANTEIELHIPKAHVREISW